MPLSFRVNVATHSGGVATTTEYDWYYDHANHREKKVYSKPRNVTSIYHYHVPCEDYDCCTAYTYGPAMKCFGANDVRPHGALARFPLDVHSHQPCCSPSATD
jgi:hypothetical protein